ncbi:MAG: zinc-ribbon domain-containing protein [Gemmataceae bacterium]|jgi:hypothetical protein|nr:zinc-ribbon domain-containing protein [Gemmataceae bacterium]
MPFVVICPECKAQLKSNSLIPAGRTLVCPSCKTKFTTEADSKQVGTTGSKASVRVPPPVAKGKPQSSRDKEDDEDFEDDDQPKKKAKSAREDEDEDDFDDEDRPKKSKKSKKQSREDEDEDDFDDEDRPKKRKQKKKSSTLPIILALVGVFVVCGGCVGTGLILYLTDNLPFVGGGGASAYKEMTKFIPNDANRVILMDFKSVLKDSELGSEIKSGISKDKDNPFPQLGLSMEDVDKAVIVMIKPNLVGGPKGLAPPREITIFKLSKSVDSADLASKLNAKESMFNNQKFYKAANDKAFFVADPKTLILSNETGIQAALGAMTQTPSDKMNKILSQVDGDIVQIEPNPNIAINEFDFLLMLAGGGGGNPIGGNAPKDTIPQSIVVNHKIKSSVISITQKITYADDATAQTESDKRKTKLDTAKNNLPNLQANLKKLGGKTPDQVDIDGFSTMIESARVSSSGSVMTLSFDVPKKGGLGKLMLR